MKMKRYFAPDIRQAIRMVREDQGPDAVILSNRKVDGGVEIVAAQDFDEQLVQEKVKRQETVSQPASPSKNHRIESYRACEVAQEQPSVRRSDFAAELAQLSHPKPEPGQGRAEAISRKQPLKAPAETVPSRQPDPVAESSVNPALFQMHKELQRMRRVLDRHLTEMGWVDSSRRNPTRLDLLRRLCERGFSRALSLKMANRLGGTEDLDLAWQKTQQLLAKDLPEAEDNLLDNGGVYALVGPTGVGKTTTIAKLAARFQLKHGPRQIALVTTDTYRIAAHEQLNTYGRILGAPVRSAARSEDLYNILAGFSDKRLVLIDTAGMGQRDRRLAEQFSLFQDSEIPVKPYLVMSAASQWRGFNEVVEAFQGFKPQACILTKLDEAGHLGAALSTLIEHRLPLAFVTDGQQVPEDLHLGRAQALIQRCLSEQGDEEASGTFTYEDWVAHATV